MNVYKEMYLQLFNKISDTIKELQDLQASVESFYANKKPDTTPYIVSIRDKQYRRISNSLVDNFSPAIADDSIDIETIERLEDMLRKKKDELQQ